LQYLTLYCDTIIYMKLADQIYQYYLNNLSSLGEDKSFHLASRMAAWTGDSVAYDILKKSYNHIVQPDKNIDKVVAELINKPQIGKRNANELRQPFFDKYPQLYGIHSTLFRIRHLESIYNIDARQSLFKSISKNSLIALERELLSDDEAIRILSTFVINYVYLLERVINKDENSLSIQRFYDIGKTYNTNDLRNLQLLIYLYTHCIIGESNFYTRTIAKEKLPIYHKMLSYLESLINSNFDRINLDNKLEFLVCARICSYPSKLFNRIYDECKNSISPEGTFIIDVHNQNAQSERNNFASSEHRNVLFIMSTSEYNPHSTLIR
jgi:hypothetical protein